MPCCYLWYLSSSKIGYLKQHPHTHFQVCGTVVLGSKQATLHFTNPPEESCNHQH